MPTLQWYDVKEAGIGDTAPDLWFVVTEDDQTTVRVITGYAAWVTFWYEGPGVTPHLVRGALVDGANGRIKYEMKGDEFPTAGGCYFQWTISKDVFDGGQAGAGYFQRSGPIIRRTIIG